MVIKTKIRNQPNPIGGSMISYQCQYDEALESTHHRNTTQQHNNRYCHHSSFLMIFLPSQKSFVLHGRCPDKREARRGREELPSRFCSGGSWPRSTPRHFYPSPYSRVILRPVSGPYVHFLCRKCASLLSCALVSLGGWPGVNRPLLISRVRWYTHPEQTNSRSTAVPLTRG